MFAIVAKEVVENVLEEPPEKIRKVLKEFLDVFSSELPDALPSMRDIKRAIYSVPSATSPNLPLYKMNPS